MAVYGFARLVDDVGDEAPGDRTRQLDAIEAELDRVYAGLPESASGRVPAAAHDGPVLIPAMRELARTIHECDVPAEPFRRLINANRQDQVVRRYVDFQALLDYCELSANPVGHIVLHVFGVATPQRKSLSDRVCTALQLLEHWQDVAEDLDRGRVYLPADDLERFGCAEAELARPAAGSRVRELLAFETQRAARMLEEGVPLVRTLSGFPKVAVAGYIAGGLATAAAIAARDHDVLSRTPRPSRVRTAGEWLRLLVVRG